MMYYTSDYKSDEAQVCAMKMEPITGERAFRASGKKKKPQLAPQLCDRLTID
jgi:hypothetical protein